MREGALRNFIFGAEDSLVSTVGLLSGVSFAGLTTQQIAITGIILIVVEALSMGAGVYISEDSANELPNTVKENQFSDALVMFFSYLGVGLIPLLPYLLISETRPAFGYSLVATLLALIFLGAFKGYVVKRSLWRSIIKITLIGGVTAAVAIIVGNFVKVG